MIDDEIVGLPVTVPHSVLAEMIVHRAFLDVDSTAGHVGGNRAVRDHELFDNTVWCNTKSGWFDTDGRLGYSGVNWSSARDASRPKHSLDLIAIVLVDISAVRAVWTPSGITYTWPDTTWYLVPASILHAHHVVRSVVRQAVDLDLARPFEVSVARPLTLNRVKEILGLNKQLTGSSEYAFPL